MLAPYIGITDFMTRDQVVAMQRIVEDASPTDRVLHVGVMMSRKSLLDKPTKWAAAFPQKDEIKDIFSVPGVYNCLHYVDYRTRTAGFGVELARALAFGGPNLHSTQLDMMWPDPEEIRIAVAGGDIEVILQVGGRAIDQVGNDPQAVVNRLQGYQGVVHRILLDKSMGRGLGMDAAGLIPFARAIQDQLPWLGLGAAGGLGPHTFDLVKPLLLPFPRMSIDAQGQLRSSGNALDPVEWDRAGSYLRQALEYTASLLG